MDPKHDDGAPGSGGSARRSRPRRARTAAREPSHEDQGSAGVLVAAPASAVFMRRPPRRPR